MTREGARKRARGGSFVAGAPMRPGKCEPHRAQIVALADRFEQHAAALLAGAHQHHGERKRETVLCRREAMGAVEPAPRRGKIAESERPLALLPGGKRARYVGIRREGIPTGHARPILPQHDTARERVALTSEKKPEGSAPGLS